MRTIHRKTTRQVDRSRVCTSDAIVHRHPRPQPVAVAVEPAVVIERVVRGWCKVDRCELCRILEDSEFSRAPPEDADVDQLFATYDAVLRGIACSTSSRLTSPWLSITVVRRRMSIRAPECRRLERRFRKTRSANDRQQWIRATRRRFALHRQKKVAY